jgi:hypothetical protein
MPTIYNHVHKHLLMLYCWNYTLYFGNKPHFPPQTIVSGEYVGPGSV